MPAKQSVSEKAVPGELVSMNLDERTIYVFVRGDLAEEDQLVQSAHAVFDMARCQVLSTAEGQPRIVALDGGSSPKAFNKTLSRISKAIITHTTYTDPDKPELGMTAIVTAPLTKEQSVTLANYRLRRYSPPVDGAATVGSKPSGEPSRRSSEKEHSVFNGEVAGSIPADGSKIQP